MLLVQGSWYPPVKNYAPVQYFPHLLVMILNAKSNNIILWAYPQDYAKKHTLRYNVYAPVHFLRSGTISPRIFGHDIERQKQ